ncbi:MAG: Ig-like domain-containing protein [Patescibacteria group bacterium]
MISTLTRLTGIAFIAMLAIAPLSAFAADATGSFEEESFITTSTKPTLTGDAEDTKYVRVVVRNDDGKQMFKKDVRIKKDGEWKAKVSKKLKKGEYDLALYAGKTSKKSALLDEATLTVGKTEKSTNAGNGTTLSAASVPLLFGGTARANTSVPVAYIKLVNTSTKESAIEGFTLVQNGSAPTSLVTTFATNDDKSGSRAIVPASWRGNSAYVPLAATFAPGQMRIFTIKAGIGTTYMNIGQQLKLDVASINTAAKLPSIFPIVGTTWTLGY